MWKLGGGGDQTRGAGREWASGDGRDSRSSTQLEQAAAVGSLWSHQGEWTRSGGGGSSERRLDGELDSRSRKSEGVVVGGSQPGAIHRRGDVLAVVVVEILCIAIRKVS